MTQNNNVSRLSGRWRNITKECYNCEFNLNKENKTCIYGKLITHLYVKAHRIFTKCSLKEIDRNKGEKEYRVHWSLHGVFKTKGKTRKEVFKTATKNKEINDENAFYVVTKVVELRK